MRLGLIYQRRALREESERMLLVKLKSHNLRGAKQLEEFGQAVV